MSSNTATASSGVATFSGLIYNAASDGESFTLQANDDDGAGSNLPTVNANALTSDVVATQLVFTTQPSSSTSGSELSTQIGDVRYRAQYDLNKDGIVDLGDFVLFVEVFGEPT